MIHHSVNYPLVNMSNLSLQRCLFPKELKITNVSPCLKRVTLVFSTNIVQCLYYVFYQRLMRKSCIRLLKFLEDYNIIFKNTFGFTKLHSSYMALKVLTDELIKSLVNGEFVIGVFLDFPKALDIVDHAIPLSKLSHYGIRWNAIQWLQNCWSGNNM